METLVLTNKTGNNVTTSLLIADKFGKDHKNVMRDIQNLECSPEFNALNFEPIVYTDSRGRIQSAFEITKDGFSFLVMGYTGSKAAEFKEKFIVEFNKRDALLKNDDYIIERAMSVLASRAKLLETQLAAKEERLQLQESIIKEAAPKIQYFDEVLNSGKLINITVIAKELGMSGEALNDLLHKWGVQYPMGDGTWVAYAKYQAAGYTGTTTYTYTTLTGTGTNIHTKWTEKGRAFIHWIYNQKMSKTA